MKRWKLLAGAAIATVLVIAVGSAAFAMYGDDGGSEPSATDRQDADDAVGEGGGGGIAGACLEGTVDCVDTPLGPTAECAAEVVGCNDTGPGSAPRCAPEFPDCVDTYGPGGDPRKCEIEGCAGPTTDESRPALICAPDQPIEACDVPEGWECVTAESFPPQTKCFAIDCVTTLPAPTEGNPGADPVAVPTCAPPADVDPALPPECSVSSDGVTACPTPCDPVTDADRCGLPDECIVDPDGGVGCPGSEGEGIPPARGGSDPNTSATRIAEDIAARP